MVRVVAALAERLVLPRPGEPDAGRPRRELFLARRGATLKHGGLWELPGGKIEEGETAEAALLRELSEELGLGAELLGPGRHYEALVDGKPFLFIVFPVRFGSEPERLDAHEEWRWFGPSTLPGLALAPLDVPVIADWLDGDSADGGLANGDD